MISTIVAVLLFAVWIIGMATSHTMGGMLHVLPIIALSVFLTTLFRGINDFQKIDFGG